MEIKAIQTQYNGHLFRSRIEARWAVFWDALQIRWVFEPEGFELPSGRYLPDFFLPDFDAWCEIKGARPTDAEITKAAELAEHTGQNVMMHFGWTKAPEPGEGQENQFDHKWLTFYGLHIIIGGHLCDWPIYTHSNLWQSADHRMECLSDHLKIPVKLAGLPYSAGDVPQWDGTAKTGRKLVELDKVYFLNRYKKPHPFWPASFGFGDLACFPIQKEQSLSTMQYCETLQGVLVDDIEACSIHATSESINPQRFFTPRLADAYRQAQSYRFWRGGNS